MLVVDERSDCYYKEKGIPITKTLCAAGTLVTIHKGSDEKYIALHTSSKTFTFTRNLSLLRGTFHAFD